METKLDILQRLSNGSLTVGEAQEMLEALEPKRGGAIYCKIAQSGGVSLYGLQRMPVTLYGEQWARVIAFVPELQKFLDANKDRLSKKGDPKTQAPAVVISDEELLSIGENMLDKLIASRSPGYTADTRKRWNALRDAQCAPAAGSMVTPDGAAVVVG